MTKEEFVHNAMLKLASNPAIVSVDEQGEKYIDGYWLAQVANEMAEAADNHGALFEIERDADRIVAHLRTLVMLLQGNFDL